MFVSRKTSTFFLKNNHLCYRKKNQSQLQEFLPNAKSLRANFQTKQNVQVNDDAISAT